VAYAEKALEHAGRAGGGAPAEQDFTPPASAGDKGTIDMKTLRFLVLMGAIVPLAALASTQSFAQAGGQLPQMCRPGPDDAPPVLSPADRVTCAEAAVDRARRQLDRLTQQNRDTAEAEQRLADAEAELAAAQEALAEAGNQEGDDTAQTGDDTQQQEQQQQEAQQQEEQQQQEEASAHPDDTQPPADQDQQQEASTPPPQDTKSQQQQGSVVDLQLQKQGDTEAIDRIKKLREKLRQDRGGNDTASGGSQQQQQAQDDSDAQPGKIVRQSGDRTILQLDGQIIIRQGAEQETDRLLYGARDAEIDQLPNGYTRSVITREDGTKIVTTRDEFGQIVKRVRIDRRGREFVMIDDQGYNQGAGPRGTRQFNNYQFDRDLPPVHVQIPKDQYIVETRRASRRQIEQALMAPPVEQSERLYSLDEVRYSQRLRDKVRRIDVDTITFDFGSAAISPSQFGALTALGEALANYIANNPWATILVEGHTDAVGSDYANLLLSDRRAEALAVALTSYFDIPPENLITQGYGEQFLKVDTQLPERQNRRAVLRNVTGLVMDEQY
jgi:outer membrane protein OmpA-like peptidoglycan-associated protein